MVAQLQSIETEISEIVHESTQTENMSFLSQQDSFFAQSAPKIKL